jgi:hypothetical protein
MFVEWIDKALAAAEKLENLYGKSKERQEENRRKGFELESGQRVTGQRANGGSVKGGSSYLVGEKGPEIFTPTGSGMISSGGSNVTININGTQDVDLVMTRVVQELNRQGITGR